jgi:neutral ceramidase
MLRVPKAVLAGWVLALGVAASAQAAGLKAGVAKVEITPPLGEKMWGYFDRQAGAKGTLDPLFARVLVLEAGEKRLALVVLDLGRTFGPAQLERLRETARRSSGISYVLVQATHTHAGPVIQNEYPGNAVPAWETAALEKIAKAIDEARQRTVDAKLGTGDGVAYIGYNRIRVNPDGTVSMFWTNPTHVPTAPVDPTVSVLRVDAADGKPLAILVNYACHPVVFGADNLQYSADFPGVMIKTVEQAFGGGPLGFFLQGAPGDINVYDATAPLEQDAVKKRDWSGERLGQEAVRIAKGIQTHADPQASLDFAEDVMTFRLRWDLEKFRQALLAAYGQKIFDTFAPGIKKEVKAPVATVLINKRIALMTMPGEPFVDFQINWRDRCPVRDAFFLGYANGYVGYFPTIRAASLGGYGAASATSWVEVGAGERIVDHAVARVYEMLGRLSDLPEDLKNK